MDKVYSQKSTNASMMLCDLFCIVFVIRKQVTVVFPCVKMDELSKGERNQSLEGVRTAVGGFLQGLPAGAQAHSFRYGQVCVSEAHYSLKNKSLK